MNGKDSLGAPFAETVPGVYRAAHAETRRTRLGRSLRAGLGRLAARCRAGVARFRGPSDRGSRPPPWSRDQRPKAKARAGRGSIVWSGG